MSRMLSNIFFLYVFLAGFPLAMGKFVVRNYDLEIFTREYANITIESNLGNDVERVQVVRSKELSMVSAVVGWMYFVSWSVAFYPQVYENWKRKSVVGLNFDFVVLNLIGFTFYSVFNCFLYWDDAAKAEYFSNHENGMNPIQMNDIFFSLHAAFMTLIMVIQCSIHERGDQTVSTIARFIIGGFFATIIVSAGLTMFSSILTWLKFLYICSYIKLVVTFLKYIPQAIMNYKKKSTEGWSIGSVILDFTGGILSMLQMILDAINHDDWESIFGDPTKFGMGFFSDLFDVLFLVQHYILYRKRT